MVMFILQVFACMGFVVSVVWIYSLANEIVNILKVKIAYEYNTYQFYYFSPRNAGGYLSTFLYVFCIQWAFSWMKYKKITRKECSEMNIFNLR